VDPVPDPLLVRKSGRTGNRTLTTRSQRLSHETGVMPVMFESLTELNAANPVNATGYIWNPYFFFIFYYDFIAC
jgi:hypothetical protein